MPEITYAQRVDKLVQIKPTDEAYGFAPQLVPEQFLLDVAKLNPATYRGELNWRTVAEAIRVNVVDDWQSQGPIHDITTIVNALDTWERRQALGSILD